VAHGRRHGRQPAGPLTGEQPHEAGEANSGRETMAGASALKPAPRQRLERYFTSARKLGARSQPMSACLDTIASAPGVPAATPPIAGDSRVTCAVYSPYTMALTRVVAVKPSICAPAATGLVTVQVRLGVPRTSTGNTSGYPFQYGVRPNSSEENSQPCGDFADPSTRP
jgi:hypothetical protein